MNALLSALTGLVVAAATRLTTGAPLIYVEHFGPVNNTIAEDDDCTCDVDPDVGQRVLVVLPIDTAADLFEEAIRRHGNGGGTPADIGWEMARTLELGGDIE